MKKCPKCNQYKEIIEFRNDKSTKDGLSCHCKKCKDAETIKWCKNNPEKSREIKRRWYKNNKQQARESNKRWRKKVPEKIKEWNRRAKARNPAENYKLSRLWLKEHPERVKEYNRRKNIKILRTVYGRLEKTMRTYIGRWLRGNKNGRHWESLIGYTVDQLKIHLEKQFKPGMTWENHGIHGWHIDHKIPVSAFKFKKPEDEDFKLCWSLKNLQPLWAFDNISKKNKIDKSFLAQLKRKDYHPVSEVAGY